MRELKVKTVDCSCDDLLKIARKCGFTDGGGKKHYKIETFDGKFITTIPRHNCLDKDTEGYFKKIYFIWSKYKDNLKSFEKTKNSIYI